MLLWYFPCYSVYSFSSLYEELFCSIFSLTISFYLTSFYVLSFSDVLVCVLLTYHHFPTYTTFIRTSTRPITTLKSWLVVEHRSKYWKYVLRVRLSYDRHTTVTRPITMAPVLYTIAIRLVYDRSRLWHDITRYQHRKCKYRSCAVLLSRVTIAWKSYAVAFDRSKTVLDRMNIVFIRKRSFQRFRVRLNTIFIRSSYDWIRLNTNIHDLHTIVIRLCTTDL